MKTEEAERKAREIYNSRNLFGRENKEKAIELFNIYNSRNLFGRENIATLSYSIPIYNSRNLFGRENSHPCILGLMYLQ